MPLRPCLTAGCPRYAERRGRCRECNNLNDKSMRRAGRALYRSRRWQATRRAQLSDQPLCACGSLATDVDHIISLDDGGDAWSPDNLRPMCKACHSAKTRREQLA